MGVQAPWFTVDIVRAPSEAARVPAVELHGITKRYAGNRHGGAGSVAVQELSLAAEPGQFLVLVGPSGSGKTTTLRIIAGLEEPDAGTVVIDGKPTAGVPPGDRGVGLVFQDHPLFPHLDVAENLAFGLKLQRTPASEIQRRVEEISVRLGLGDLLGRLPASLSGGERQRVALGSVLVLRPRVVLLDEPLAQLDTPLRARLRGELRQVQRELGLTMIHVTHDQAEAMALADRLAVLREGALQQIGAPLELYRRPTRAFVGEFLGDPGMNLVRGRCGGIGTGSSWRTEAGGDLRVSEAAFAGASPPAEATGWLGFRAESVSLGGSDVIGGGPGMAWAAEIRQVEHLGGETRIRVLIGGVPAIVRAGPAAGGVVGTRVWLHVPERALHWFPS